MSNVEENYIKQMQKDLIKGYVKEDIIYHIKNLTLKSPYKQFEVKRARIH